MNAKERKEQAEFLATLKAALPFLSKSENTAIIELAVLWANREIVRREAAGRRSA